MFKNEQSAVSHENLGKIYHPFQKTYDYLGTYIDQQHEALSRTEMEGVIIKYADIKGFLRPAEALKLYELAYFAAGNILEFGTHQGLSSTIMAQAILNSMNPYRLIQTVDIAHKFADVAIENHQRMGVTRAVQVNIKPAGDFIQQLLNKGEKFSFVFIDHDHSYEATVTVIQALNQLLIPEGFVLFHDFNDRRNMDPERKDYGIIEAVDHHLSSAYEFYGTFGSVALYRYMPVSAS